MNCATGVCSREIIYMFLVSHMSGLVRNFNIWIFSYATNVINVILCMMVLCMELYLFITVSVTLTFQGHSNVSFTIRLSWNFRSIVKYIEHVINIPPFFTFTHIQGSKIVCFLIYKNSIVGSFTDTVQVRFFKPCIVMTLLGVSQLIPGLMILILFQGHRCVQIVFLDSCPLQFKHCMVLLYLYIYMYICKIRHSTLCMTGVYSRDITNLILNFQFCTWMWVVWALAHFLFFFSFFLSFFLVLVRTIQVVRYF